MDRIDVSLSRTLPNEVNMHIMASLRNQDRREVSINSLSLDEVQEILIRLVYGDKP